MQLSDRIGRRMKLQDLHVLMTVVQAGSMSKAAKLLNTTQSAISRSVADLEQTIGVQLLDRGPHGVVPTQYGRALLKHGVVAFDELKQGVKNIEFLADPTAGEVRIGSTISLAASFVSAVIDRLSRHYPRIVFHVVATATETLHSELNERNVDLLIARGGSSFTDEQFAFETLYGDSFVVVAGAQNPWVRRRRIELAALVNEPWALPAPEGEIGSVFMETFRASGLDYPHATVVTLPREVRMSLVVAGRFLTMCSPSILRFPTRRSDIRILPVELALARVPVGIVTLKNRTLSPVAQLFLEHAREIANIWRREHEVRLWPILLQKSAASLYQSGLFFWKRGPPADPTVSAGRGGTVIGVANAPLTQRTWPPDPEDETSVWRFGASSGQWLRA